ncbi:MAG: PDZ domain-containing protein [Phycisphaerales bacterium]
MNQLRLIMLVSGFALASQATMLHAQSTGERGVRLRSLYGGQAGASGGDNKNVVIVDGQKKFEIKLENDKVVSVIVDGKTVGNDRAEVKGPKLRILGSDGKVLFESDSVLADEPAAGAASQQWLRAPRALSLLEGLGVAAAAGGEAASPPPKTMLGVTLENPAEQLASHLGLDAEACTVITGTHDGLPAEKAGIKKYDVVVAIEGKAPAGPSAIRERLKSLNPGEKLNLTIIHKGEKKDVAVVLDAYDAAKLGTLLGDATAPDAPLAELRMLENRAQAGDATRWLTLSPAQGARGSVIIERDNNGKKERIVRELDEDGDVRYTPAPPLPPAAPAAPGSPFGSGPGRGNNRGVFMLPDGDRMERLEDRIKKLEELLERIDKKIR